MQSSRNDKSDKEFENCERDNELLASDTKNWAKIDLLDNAVIWTQKSKRQTSYSYWRNVNTKTEVSYEERGSSTFFSF